MEKIKIEKPEAEKEKGYHHPEIAEIESAMTDLVEKLKEKIDNGEYDTIISDDVGGRIPSLILRKIIRDRDPSQKIGTYFVVGGFSIRKKEQQEVVREFLKKKQNEVKKRALLVTEFIHSGESLEIFSELMQENNIDFDVAITYSFAREDEMKDRISGPEIFIGDNHPPHHDGSLLIHSRSSQLTGVEQSDEPSAHPTLYKKMLPIKGKKDTPEQKEEFLKLYNEYYVEEDKKEKARLLQRLNDFSIQRDEENKIISEEDLKKLKEDMIKTRKDISRMAENIIDKVWAN